MKFHKNINAWYRLLINLFDFMLFASLIIFDYYFLMVNKGEIKALNFYSFLALSSILILVLFLLIPLFYSGRTLGMIIFRVQIIPSKKMKLRSLRLLPLKKQAFNLVIWFLIILISTTLVMPNEINEFSQFVINKSDGKGRYLIAYRLIVGLSGFWFTLILANFIMIIGSKANLGLFDHSSNSRIVYIKHYSHSSYLKEIKLVPFKCENELVIYNKK
ncbi:RDD family protein [Mycoplasmopsis caviae]|uniref:RDD family protein n=1 Tax=Mycoplasmopsis caviae TaxID=55603 RepID=A0A3P8LIP2_9BACT|nr:RDD family protein [Mycoplasmopsis caviae]UUD34738.1 RDD family protein [Mycoplasmopsis caviae]VDR42432.1 Uncharacterised protein [Mycoplasmopsis caviae]